MTVNRGGILKPEYFHSYLSLVMNARNFDLEQAGDYVIETFFKGNAMRFGPESYNSFVQAIKTLKEKER